VNPRSGCPSVICQLGKMLFEMEGEWYHLRNASLNIVKATQESTSTSLSCLDLDSLLMANIPIICLRQRGAFGDMGVGGEVQRRR
jgi:hypothetical protein